MGTVGKWHIGVERGPDYYEFDGLHYPGWGAPVTTPTMCAIWTSSGLPPFRTGEPLRGRFPNGQPSNITAGRYEGPVEGTYSVLPGRTHHRDAAPLC